MPSRLKVCETFLSIQGEGALVGYPCFFIRLTGCNLRCTYCDTSYAYHEGEMLSVDSLVERAIQSRASLVEITGGEPLVQGSVYRLMERLVAVRKTVLLETNGSIDLSMVPRRVIKIVDMKTPGSGMDRHWHRNNLRWIGAKDQLKFVITDRYDYEWAVRQIQRFRLTDFTQVIISPCWGRQDPAELARWVVEDAKDVRFQLQLHKILWGDKRGV